MLRAGAAALALAAALAFVPPVGAEEEACAPPDCIEASVPVPEGFKVPENRARVLLPRGYGEDPCLRYPVLYLLHGVGDSYESWTEHSQVVALTRDLPLIVVMPDGGGNPEAGWYSDWADGSRQWETFHTEVLVDWVDRTFRTVGERSHRAVAGFSMGGFGAMKYTARHPELFTAAASLSGMVDSMYAYPLSGPGYTAAGPYAGTPDDRVWGNQLEDEEQWRAHNPTDRAADLRGAAVFVYSGTGTPPGEEGENPEKAANYPIENFILQMSLSFMRALDEAGVPYESEIRPGYHDWPYYEAGLRWALPQLLDVAGEATADAACVASASGGPGSGDDGPEVAGAVADADGAAGGGTLPATGPPAMVPALGLALGLAGAALAQLLKCLRS